MDVDEIEKNGFKPVHSNDQKEQFISSAKGMLDLEEKFWLGLADRK